MSTRRDWRAGWLGRILGIHSPSAHARGECWCKATRREIFLEQITARHVMSDMESFYRFISELPCYDSSCSYQEPHKHGFACNVTCVVCRRLTKGKDAGSGNR